MAQFRLRGRGFQAVRKPKPLSIALAGIHVLEQRRKMIMTVKDLIDELKKYPENSEIFVATECHGCFEEADHVRLDDRGMVVIESGSPPIS